MVVRVACVSANTSDVWIPCLVDLDSGVFELNFNDLAAGEVDGGTDDKTLTFAEVGDVDGYDVTVQEFMILSHECNVSGIVDRVVERGIVGERRG